MVFQAYVCGLCVGVDAQYHLNGMYQEALNTYSLIVKNKQYPQSGRLRVNMGNIYFEQVWRVERCCRVAIASDGVGVCFYRG